MHDITYKYATDVLTVSSGIITAGMKFIIKYGNNVTSNTADNSNAVPITNNILFLSVFIANILS